MAAPAKKPAASRIFYTAVNERNLGNVRLLIDTVLPVRYSEEFYKRLPTQPADFTKMAYFDDIFVGVVGSRLEGEGAAKKLYIMVLAVLAPYRDRGVGSALLKEVIDATKKHPDIKEIYLHVQTSNDDALRFYERHGFVRGEVVENYYRGARTEGFQLMSMHTAHIREQRPKPPVSVTGSASHSRRAVSPRSTALAHRATSPYPSSLATLGELSRSSEHVEALNELQLA